MVGSVAISYIQRARPGTDINIFNVAKAWITAYFSMTMSSNIICSGEPTVSFMLMPLTYVIGAIATRIYLAWKSQSRGNARLYRRIVFAIVESSALYALGVLASLVSFVSGTNGQYAAVDAIIPLVVSPISFLYLSFLFSLVTPSCALRGSYSVSLRSKSTFTSIRQVISMSTHEDLPSPGRAELDRVETITPLGPTRSLRLTSRREGSQWRFT